MTLAELPGRFAAARSAASAAARYSSTEAPPDVCRYCGGHLRLFQHQRNRALDGHARCCVTLEFQLEVYNLWWNTLNLSRSQIAKACGVSATAVSRWLSNASGDRL